MVYMSDPNVFPANVFPLEYWPLEYWPMSISVAEKHGCVNLNDWLNSDVIIVDRLINNALLSDLSNSDTSVSDVVCPN